MPEDIDQYLDRLETTGTGKVYCRDCRFLGIPPGKRPLLRRRFPSLEFVGLPCLHPHAHHTRETWLAQEYPCLLAQERNADNDCQDFAPATWWQRWGLPSPLLVAGLLVVGYLLCWGFPWQ